MDQWTRRDHTMAVTITAHAAPSLRVWVSPRPQSFPERSPCHFPPSRLKFPLMRPLLAGLVFLAVFTSSVSAQVDGFVESIGYNNSYRPDCWTPLLVNLRSKISEPMNYQLQVWQEDLDRDRVVYTKDITLSPNAQDKFQLYFIPRPTDGGLPVTPNELARALQVRVCKPPKEGQRPEDAAVIVDRLSIQFAVDDVDPQRGFNNTNQGKRLVLWVGDSASKLNLSDYKGAIGQTQDVQFVQVPLNELGENVLYYNAADAVLWLGANAEDLDKGGAKRLEALEEYVREGGQLVVCQPNERGKIGPFAPLLPIELRDAADRWLVDLHDRPALDPKIDALPQLSKPKEAGALDADWSAIKGPIPIAIARQLKSNAVVDVLQSWDPKDHLPPSPYIVRRAYGLGAVTWVAQDLGNPNLRAAKSDRWPYVWDSVFGWNEKTLVLADVPQVDSGNANSPQSNLGYGRPPRRSIQAQNTDSSARNLYAYTTDPPVDLGQSLLKGMDFDRKAAGYIFIAMIFFIGYWIVAGPGTYLFLSNKKKREWNWFMFGFWAFVATALTLGVVRLLLHGGAEVKHQTIVRITPGQPVYVHSRVGLYIPRDGYQTVELKDTSKDAASFITPFNIHPAYLTPTDFPAAQDYSIPVHDDPQPVRVQIPYRSTLKKLQVRWVGDSPMAIGGSAQLVPADRGHITGKLTNLSGTDLKNIWVVFSHVDSNGRSSIQVLSIPEWPKEQTLDLFDEFKTFTTDPSKSTSTNKKNRLGTIDIWATTWYGGFSSSMFGGPGDNRGDDFASAQRSSFPMMSLIDLLPPDKNDRSQNHQRITLLRRGGYDLNCSQAVLAGQLVILAESKENDRPLPFPLVVDGDKVAGEGVVLYQFVLPLDRTEMLKAVQPPQPQTLPATKPAG